MLRTILFAYFSISLLLGSGVVYAETVRIATGEYPPWTSQSLPHGGYINHIVKRAFYETGVDVEFHYMPWKRALETTRLGQYHASSFWGYNEDRLKDFVPSQVVTNDPVVLFYRAELAPLEWSTLSDLTSYKFGATRGYTYTKEFWQLANEDILRVATANDDVKNFRKLVNGEIDIFPISTITGRYLLEHNFSDSEIQNVIVDEKLVNRNEDYILFSKKVDKNELIVEKFNQGLEILKTKGELKKILE